MRQGVVYEIPAQNNYPYPPKAVDMENGHPVKPAGIQIISLDNPATAAMKEDMRRNFIRKVLGILVIQLIITTLAVGVTFIDKSSTRKFLNDHQYGLWIALVISIVVILALSFSRSAFRKVPLNYFLLFLYTASTAYLLASIAAASKSTSVLFASGFTLFAVFVISSYAWKTKRDLTKKMAGVMSLFSVLFMILIFGLIFRSHILSVIIGAGFGLVFSFMFAINVQRLSGKYEAKYSLDEYIIAALDLYIDIVQIFLAVLGFSNLANN